MSYVDLAFLVTGRSIPADHGYALYSAISQHIPSIHLPPTSPDSGETPDTAPTLPIAVHPINGRLMGDRTLALTIESRLIIRIESVLIGEILPLAGKQLRIDGGTIQVGTLEIRPLKPAPRLYSRLVTIKGFLEPGPFLEAVARQLAALGIKGVPGLLKRQGEKSFEGRSGLEDDRSPFIRRTIRIRDKEVVGYALEVRELSADDSIRLQENGLGGRRHFGCGIFVPTKGTSDECFHSFTG